jgi:hypothetical protein
VLLIAMLTAPWVCISMRRRRGSRRSGGSRGKTADGQQFFFTDHVRNIVFDGQI